MPPSLTPTPSSRAPVASKPAVAGGDTAIEGDGGSGGGFSTEQYFETQAPPAGLKEHAKAARDFVERHKREARRVVLVTSGGTTVPLEHNVVRFLDNFSAGTRGATSAEYFLSSGYAVIFMHRQHSLQPYTRHYSHTFKPFLDLLEEAPAGTDEGGNRDGSATATDIRVSSHLAFSLLPILRCHKKAQREHTLLSIPFVTVNEYLFLLREMSSVMSGLGRAGMYYLAAAVSDFFVPTQRMSEHKIQSGKGSLSIEMDQVPKVLKPMVQEWTPEGYVVSFKLETDRALLVPKACQALERYGHQVVIGNTLQTRKHEVVFVERRRDVSPSEEPAADGSGSGAANNRQGRREDGSDGQVGVGVGAGFVTTWIRLELDAKGHGLAGEREIEEDIVRELVSRHGRWIREGEAAEEARRA